MSAGKKGQAALEYMLVVGVIGIMILPAAYMFFRYSQGSAQQIDAAQLDKLGRELVSTAERVYYQGAPSRTVLEARMPQGVEDIQFIGEWGTGSQMLIIKARSGEVDTEFPYPSLVNINGSFNASMNQPSRGAGIKKISIEAYETPTGANGQSTPFVHVNFGGRCPPSVVHDFDTSGAYDASDGAFFSGCCTNSAGHPKFRPSRTWQGGWVNTTGDFSGNPYASCINADYDGDCDVDEADRQQFCTATGLQCAPIPGC